MTIETLLQGLIPAFERVGLPYMLTGSVVSSAFGMPRSTLDLDVVIRPTREQLLALVRQFPSSDYYADEQQALQALASRSQFNVIDHASGWKVDFIIAEESDYGRTAFERRRSMQIAGRPVQVASAEDVVIAKLRWAKLGGSERQLSDVAGIVRTQGDGLDMTYIERWVGRLDLDELWRSVRDPNAS